MIFGLIFGFGILTVAYMLFVGAGAVGGVMVAGILAVCAVLFFLKWLLAPYGVLGDFIVIAFLIFAAVMIVKKLYTGTRSYLKKVNRSVKAERQKAVEEYERKQ